MAFPPSSLFQEAEYVRPSLNFEPMEIDGVSYIRDGMYTSNKKY